MLDYVGSLFKSLGLTRQDLGDRATKMDWFYCTQSLGNNFIRFIKSMRSPKGVSKAAACPRRAAC